MKTLLITLFTIFCLSIPTWDIPVEYKNKENPTTVTDKSIENGRAVYLNKKCNMCHGLNADKKFDFELQKNSTDGELYYMTFVGNGKMPNFEKKITFEVDRWDLINYLRSVHK